MKIRSFVKSNIIKLMNSELSDIVFKNVEENLNLVEFIKSLIRIKEPIENSYFPEVHTFHN